MSMLSAVNDVVLPDCFYRKSFGAFLTSLIALANSLFLSLGKNVFMLSASFSIKLMACSTNCSGSAFSFVSFTKFSRAISASSRTFSLSIKFL